MQTADVGTLLVDGRLRGAGALCEGQKAQAEDQPSGDQKIAHDDISVRVIYQRANSLAQGGVAPSRRGFHSGIDDDTGLAVGVAVD